MFLSCLFTLLQINVFAQYTPSMNMDSISHIDYQALHGANLNDVWGYVDELGNEYAIVGTTKGTSIVDITIPSSPVEVFWLAGMESIWRDPCVYADYAYVTTEAQEGLTIIDLSPLPQSNNLTYTLYTGPADNPWKSAHTCFTSQNGYAYIFGENRGNKGAIILDIHSNPMAPVELGWFDNWYAHDGFERNDTLYLAHIYDGFFSLVDVSDKSNPVLISTHPTPNNFSHNIWPSTTGKYVFTTDEVSGAFIGCYDISNPSNITKVDQIQNSPGAGVIPHNTHVKGDYLITSYYSDGVIIHDVTYPYNIVKVGSYDTYPGQTIGYDGDWGTYPFFPSGTIICSDISKGLFILQPHYAKASYLEGIVTDASNGNPLNDVGVQIVGNDQKERTSSVGFYATGKFQTGNVSVSFFKVGYYPQTLTVDLQQGIITNLNAQLVPIPPFGLHVSVTDNNGVPLSDVNIQLEYPLITHEGTTNGLGEREFALYYAGNYHVTIGKWGYITQCQDVYLDSSVMTLNYQLEKGYYDDFEFDYGWAVSGTATTGMWERGKPNPTNNTVMGVDADFDCGDQAFVTGNDPNFNPDFDDVDGGNTFLTSPQMDLTTYATPYINYTRAFYCYHGPHLMDDTLRIYISNGTDVVLIDQVGAPQGNPMQWENVSIPINGLLPINSTMQIFVRISDDAPNINVTEAAFDFFRVTNASTLSVENNEEIQWLVFPNPTRNTWTLSGLKMGDELIVFDLQGKCIYEKKVTENTSVIDASNWENGAYLIQSGSQTKRVLKY